MKENIWEADCGFPGVETQMPLMLTAVNQGKITLEHYVKISSENPARAFGLWPHKGNISVGAHADVTVIDIHRKETIRAANLHSRGKITPFENLETTGGAKTLGFTITNGSDATTRTNDRIVLNFSENIVSKTTYSADDFLILDSVTKTSTTTFSSIAVASGKLELSFNNNVAAINDKVSDVSQGYLAVQQTTQTAEQNAESEMQNLRGAPISATVMNGVTGGIAGVAVGSAIYAGSMDKASSASVLLEFGAVKRGHLDQMIFFRRR